MSIQVWFKITIKDSRPKEAVASELFNLNLQLFPYSKKVFGEEDPYPNEITCMSLFPNVDKSILLAQVAEKLNSLHHINGVDQVKIFHTSDEDIKDKYSVITDTERRLRDIVEKVMVNSHGHGWETNNSIGFSDDQIRVMEQRRTDERNNLSNQPISNRLLDYAHILDLKFIIEKHWPLFASILPSRDTTMVYIHKINEFRNPMAHSRTELLEHQHELVRGICGELVQSIDRWSVGYRHHVKSYYCEFNFSEYTSFGDIEGAQAKSAQRAIEWSNRIESFSRQPPTLRDSTDFGKEKLIRLPKGNARISLPHTKHMDYGKTSFWTSTIQAEIYTEQALDYILTQGKHPYWAVDWRLDEDFELDKLLSNIKENTGRTPSSSTATSSSNGTSGGDAEFGFRLDNDEILRIYLAQGGSGCRAIIGLRYTANGEEGFFQAHKVFTPDDIFSFLQGEINLPDFKSKIRKAKNYPSTFTL